MQLILKDVAEENGSMIKNFTEQMDLLGGFTIIKLVGLINLDIDKEELLKINEELNSIKKEIGEK